MKHPPCDEGLTITQRQTSSRFVSVCRYTFAEGNYRSHQTLREREFFVFMERDNMFWFLSKKDTEIVIEHFKSMDMSMRDSFGGYPMDYEIRNGLLIMAETDHDGAPSLNTYTCWQAWRLLRDARKAMREDPDYDSIEEALGDMQW